MQSIVRFLFVVVLVAGLASPALVAQGVNVTGDWAFSVQTDQGGGTPTITFKQDGEKLTGKYNGQLGAADLTGTVKGTAIHFTFTIDVQGQNAPVSYDGTVDPQYPGLKGVWKDTLWVKSVQKVKNGPYMSYTLITRTRYERYIGEYVLHCHILDHEDQGMMQNVEIVLPNGAGGVAHGHH